MLDARRWHSVCKMCNMMAEDSLEVLILFIVVVGILLKIYVSMI